MKPLFAIDVTENKKNDKQNGEEFLIRSVTDMIIPGAKKPVVAPTVKKKPVLLIALRILAGLVGFGLVALVVYNAITQGFSEAYAGSPVIFYACGACLVLWCVLTLLTLGRYRDPDLLSKIDRKKKATQGVLDNVYSDLGVPDDADEVDVFSFRYRVSKGENEIVVPKTQYTEYININVRAYVKDRKLCLADLANVYSIDLASLKKIIKINKTATFPYWNKMGTPKDSLYAPYKVSYRDSIFKVKPYYLLLIEVDKKDYGLYFPSYELKKFERLTELTAEEK